MKTKGFGDFFAKTSKIIERALGNSTDVTGAFFEVEEDDDSKAKHNKGERI